MADHADNDDGDGDIFVYRGGRAPQHVTHVLIDESVDEIEDNAFNGCEHLLHVDTHDGIRKVGKSAFEHCASLRRINLKSAVDIDDRAFHFCINLVDVEFGDRLERIGEFAFAHCYLEHLKLPSIITIGTAAFDGCRSLTDIEFSERLESMGIHAFHGCERLQRIAIPLKRDLFQFKETFPVHNQFHGCEELSTFDLVGGIHETVASLHMDSWRKEMRAEINRINEVIYPNPNNYTFPANKTGEIRQWMKSVIDKIDHYKAEHCRYVKEGITLLELALWKANLGETEDSSEEGMQMAEIEAKAARKERRVTCGADIVIKNVLPFLQLNECFVVCKNENDPFEIALEKMRSSAIRGASSMLNRLYESKTQMSRYKRR